MIARMATKVRYGLLLVVAATGLTACVEDDEVLREQVPLAYVVKPIFNGGATQFGDPDEIASYSPGGELMLRFNSTTKAVTYRITRALTLGDGDVSDPEVSFDGKKIVFALRCGLNASQLCNGNNTWNIWEYDTSVGDLDRGILRQLTDDLVYDDLDPAYLPDGRIVFTSNRQVNSREVMTAMGYEPYIHLDETPNEQAHLLHTMDATGANIRQISFGQSHDRNPTIGVDGRILFARWNHVGDRNQYSICKINPDGSGLDIVYGGHELYDDTPNNPNDPLEEISFVHPMPMPDGRIMSTMMPINNTFMGGALAIINPGRSSNSHYQPTPPVPIAGYSPTGRFTTPYPLWDGTQRALVSYTPPRPDAPRQANNQPLPAYGIRMLDWQDQTLTSLVVPDIDEATGEPSVMYVDPVAVMKRPRPPSVPAVDQASPLALQPNQLGGNLGVAVINIKSVYYTDEQERMGNAALIRNVDFPTVQLNVTPQMPTVTFNNREVPDLNILKSPVLNQQYYLERPARFIRVVRAFPRPPGLHPSIPGAGMDMMEILGYAVVEPDGSAKFQVPANVPIGIQVLDGSGRAFAIHTGWIQARPGETVYCTGCHTTDSPDDFPPTLDHAGRGSNEFGVPETMAETLYPYDAMAGSDTGAPLSPDIQFNEVWTTGGTDPAIDLGSYDDLGLPLGNVASPYVANADNSYRSIAINFKQHILPIFERRGCTGCHTDMDLNQPLHLTVPNATPASGWVLPYTELLQENIGGGEARVNVGRAFGGARGSLLGEVIFNQELRSAANVPIGHSMNVASLLPVERRLLVEWMDLGGQYYNDPFIDGAGGDGVKDYQTELRGINQ